MEASLSQIPVIGQTVDWASHFGPIAIDYSLAALRAILILVIGIWLAKTSSRYLRRVLNKIPHLDATLINFLAISLKYTIWAFTLVVVMGQLGIQTASIIALLGAAGIAIGLALQGTLQNIAAGLMLLFLRPFQVGDYIEAGTVAGTIKQLGLFNTEITTIEGQYMTIPNSNLWNVPIINFSRNPSARIDIDVSISYHDDIDVGLNALKKLADQHPLILKDPAPQCLVTMLAASSVDLRLRCWVASNNQWASRFDLIKEVKQAIQAAGLTIPFPQQVLHIQPGHHPSQLISEKQPTLIHNDYLNDKK